MTDVREARRYLTQEDVARRLHMDGRKLLRDRVEFPARDFARDAWDTTRGDLATFARGAWAEAGAHTSIAAAESARRRIAAYAERELRQFRSHAVTVLKESRSQAYELQSMMAHWILDQTTPPEIKVRPPAGAVVAYDRAARAPRRWGALAREAFVDEPIAGDDPDEQRIDGWIKAWAGGLTGMLSLAGAQGAQPADVAARLEALEAEGNDLAAVMSRLIQSSVQVSIADADDDFDDRWGHLLEDRVWTTMDDERVCDRCASHEGESWDDTRADIPRHPLCRCWWRVVPRPWAQLTKDPVSGVADTSMVIRGPDGKPAGVVVVSFDSWAQSLHD